MQIQISDILLQYMKLQLLTSDKEFRLSAALLPSNRLSDQPGATARSLDS